MDMSIACSSPRDSDALFWHLWVLHTHGAHTPEANVHTHKIKILKKKVGYEEQTRTKLKRKERKK